jgi:hypothetical protein
VCSFGFYFFLFLFYHINHCCLGCPHDWGASLVKAEAATGLTQQILYQTQIVAHFPPPELYWTDDFHYLLLYNRGQDTPTGIEWSSTTIDLRQNTDIMLPQEISDMGHLEFCSQFSPQGQYLTARASLDDALSGWALVTPEGQIVQTVGSDKLREAGIDWMECPVWLSDETAFYFLGGFQDEANLFKYVVADDTIVNVKPLYPPDPQDSVLVNLYPEMPIRLAPDDATLAFSFRGIGSAPSAILVLTPTNEWIAFGNEETPVPSGEYPAWFPPTENP